MKRIEVQLDNGNTVVVYKHPENDANGNPRYFVHFLELNLDDYVSNKQTRSAGLRKYTGRLFGGGYTFSTYNVEASIKKIMQILHGELL